jgi:hypothetical protein
VQPVDVTNGARDEHQRCECYESSSCVKSW